MYRLSRWFLSNSAQFRCRCVRCRKTVDYEDVFNKHTVHNASHKTVCIFCLKRCAQCYFPRLKSNDFNASEDLCNSCYVLRQASLENVYFRYPQLKYNNIEEYEKMKKYIQKEAEERDQKRVAKGYMSAAEVKQRYYHRNRHRPV